MSNNLIIFLVSICIFTIIIMYQMVRKKKILFKHAIMWTILDLILLIAVFSLPLLKEMATLVGIEQVSNMIFLFGFLVLLAICISLTSIVAEQKNKIIVLTQEMGIMNNKLRGLYDNKDQKNNNK